MAVLLTAVVSMGFVSCGDDDKDETSNPETPIEPVEPDKNNAKSPEEQKEYLETVALEFMKLMPSSDFREIAEARHADEYTAAPTGRQTQ